MESVTFNRQMNGVTRVDMEEFYDEVELQNLYQWLDRVPLTRPRKDISKDFQDAVLLAEIVKHYLPKMVEMHNYQPVINTKGQLNNWAVLNRKVLKKLDLELSDDVMRAIVKKKPGVMEKVLMLLRYQLDRVLQRQGRSRAEVDEKFMTVATLKSKPDSTSIPSQKDELQKSSRESEPKSKDRALVPLKTGRTSPGKQLVSPRRYKKGEIPHDHPDRSSYHFEGKPFLDPIYIYPTTDNVPRSYLEEKQMECLAKDETIRILNSKIRRLEHLLHLKDSRISDLQHQMARDQVYASPRDSKIVLYYGR